MNISEVDTKKVYGIRLFNNNQLPAHPNDYVN